MKFLKLNKILSILFLVVSFNTVFAQWNQSTGLTGANCQRFIKLGNTVFAGTDGAGVWKSIDDGFTWVQSSNGLSPSTDYSITELTLLGANTLIAATYHNGVFKSNDNGANWISITGTLPASSLYPVTAIASNANMIIVGIESQGIYYTTDSGITWTQANTGWTTSMFYRTLIIVNSNVYATTQDGVFKSSINTFSWTPINNGLPGTPPSIRTICNQNDILYLGTSNDGIYRSLDFGQNWTSLNTPTTQNFRVSTIIFDVDKLYFASNGSANDVYSTNLSNINWSVVGTGLASSPNDLIISNSQLLAATGSDGPYKISLTAGITENINENNINISPNPSEGIFNIQLNSIENSTIKITNVLGKCVYQNIYASESIQIDLSVQGKGVYFVSIKTNKGLIIQKLIVD
jgi:photosystem II stability/assembly factor-like uncharacterized protein